MTRLEIITRLCEMAAELADLEQQAQEPDVKFGVSSIEEEMQKTLRELQGES
jgi:O-succinylbenzoate synthase